MMEEFPAENIHPWDINIEPGRWRECAATIACNAEYIGTTLRTIH